MMRICKIYTKVKSVHIILEMCIFEDARHTDSARGAGAVFITLQCKQCKMWSQFVMGHTAVQFFILQGIQTVQEVH